MRFKIFNSIKSKKTIEKKRSEDFKPRFTIFSNSLARNENQMYHELYKVLPYLMTFFDVKFGELSNRAVYQKEDIGYLRNVSEFTREVILNIRNGERAYQKEKDKK